MKYVCNACNKTYSVNEESKFCPYCGSHKIERTGRKSALNMLNTYNELKAKMDKIIEEEFMPLYLEAECIRDTLRVYKMRGLITEEELPKKERDALMNKLSEYRKNKKLKDKNI